MSIALKAENVSIRYITGDFKDIGIKEYVVRHLTHNYHVNEFMAVDGVSFELENGDMLGIIGTNGAGKSTLLKAVAGIMEPTHGKITTEGEVAALLELGSGFDGDLTVKENAYLRGAMLGYTKAFMDETYDQIIDFAELREFEDRPFKQLSSGMKSRLAFSIASLVKPDILILDEVLSVGDGAFQEKSAKKMREIISQGATTILVSHSLEQIRELCNKVLWLDHGRQVAFGETQEICDIYEKYLRGETDIAVLKDNNLPKDYRLGKKAEPKVGQNILSGKRESFMKGMLCRIIPCLVLACCFSMFVGKIYHNFPLEKKTAVELVADLSSGAVTFRGGIKDGNWINPEMLIQDSTNWVHNEEENVYTAVDETPLYLLLPAAESFQLTFSASPNEGVVRLISQDTTESIALTTDEFDPSGHSYTVSTGSPIYSKQQVMLLALVISFFILLLLCFWCKGDYATSARKTREFWLDFLKVIAAVMIIIIHAVGQMYAKGPMGSEHWKGYLFVNTITRCAVPLFIMISGVLLLGKKISLKKTLKSTGKAVVLLVFWNTLYISFQGGNSNEILREILKLPVDHGPSGHLWYSYLLIWIYLFSPILGELYRTLSKKQCCFFIIITTVIPGILWIYQKFGAFGGQDTLNGFSLYMTPTYMGIMFLGRFLYDNLANSSSIGLPIAAVIVGLFGSMILTYEYYKNTGNISDLFLFEQNLLIVMYSAGVLALGFHLRNALNRLPCIFKRMITILSQVSLGIYFAHCMVLWMIPEFTIGGYHISRLGSPLSIVGISLITYAITGLIVLSMKCVPVLKRLVQ